MAQDPKRKARSSDPGWKYGFWPDVLKKEMVQCIFCKKVVPAGIKRFKQHLAGGFGDAVKCPKAPELVRKEMHAYLKKNSRTVLLNLDEGEQGEAQEGQEGGEAQEQAGEVKQQPARVPSSGTKIKQAKIKIAQTAISSFLVSGPVKPQTQKYSKSEIMLESIGQYGHGYRSPTYHDIRGPLLERAVERTAILRKKHEEAWKEYGCTIMSDGWTDTSHRHLINFLANSPAGTFFLGSVNASSEVADANMLADLLENQIDKVGKEYVVQLVTDNGANFKAAGRILMERIPHLFWTPCATHCLNLMLQDIGEIKDFNTAINWAKKLSRFIYKHGRLLDLMRDKIGGDLVRPDVTRFATSYLTLASMHQHKNGLKTLFVSDEWQANTLSKTAKGQQCQKNALSLPFWNKVENCLRASQPLLVALRIADGDETPAAPEIMAAMDIAKSSIKESLKDKPSLLNEVMGCYEKRWENQMEQKLYGAALFLNPGNFCSFTSPLSLVLVILFFYFSTEHCIYIAVLWWGSYGGLAYELQSLAKRIITSGCERNWSAFAHVHTKKRNRLEHKRLNKLVYVSYNRKMANRFQKIRELGSKGKRSNPLLLEEFQWENEWVDENSEPVHTGAAADDAGNTLTWAQVDVASEATEALRGRGLPRAAAARAAATVSHTYARKRKRPRKKRATDIAEEDDSDHEMIDAANDQLDGSDSEAIMDQDQEDADSGGCAIAAAGGFQLNSDLLN
ncbi:hypothetical protein PVAP13_7KG180555 [Panicum virgatum]|uniref:DUF659 domain-containing protein n=1 Tax=Panicum virgatum TaxID=38727 RepID=A0A8T0QH09_PANVG|nr:hypothetical protein PVAP13_7KG180555 [Panicum virgatum]